MNLNEYQERAMMTCMATSENFSYMMLNLVGEVGEFASKVGKALRKGKVSFKNDGQLLIYANMSSEAGYEFEENLRKEAGDILWQLAGLCSVMGWELEDVAWENLNKLQTRKENGTIDGNGDGNSKEERGYA